MLRGMAPRTLRIAVPESSLGLEGRACEEPDALPEVLAVVAPPHPLYGGSIDNPVVKTLEGAYRAARCATLAFNFRGVGDSDGAPSADLALARADYMAAARALPQRKPRWLSGYSFGSCAALMAGVELASEHVLLIAPPLGLLDPALLRAYVGKLVVVVGEHDDYCPVRELRVLVARAGRGSVTVLDGVDHFFAGNQLQLLAEALPGLIE
jgi:alpha/beta superfamily hydrolase